MSVSEVGIAIKERRKLLKISQPHLANLAGISVNTLYKIESGQANPTITILNKVLEILGVELILQVKQTSL